MSMHDGTIPVRLKLGTRQWYTPGSSVYDYWTYIRVKVKNIAYGKSVMVGYQDSEGNWQEVPVDWVANYGNYDLFGASLRPPFSHFYLHYQVAGSDYYDNNGLADYHVAEFEGVVGGEVILSEAEARQTYGGSPTGGSTLYSWIEGQIYVNNLSYHKSVGIIYTYDNWATVHTAYASYAGGAEEGSVIDTVNGVEVWDFQTPSTYDGDVSDYKFAVFYEDLDGGITYWDNNFQQDYTLAKSDGSRLE